MSAYGGEAEIFCSMRAFLFMTRGGHVEVLWDASLSWRGRYPSGAA